MLNDLKFTDLYLSNERFAFKEDGKLESLSENLFIEARELLKSIETVSEKSKTDNFSYNHESQRYRVQLIEHINGKLFVLRKISKQGLNWNNLGFPGYYLPKILDASDIAPVKRGGLILISGRPDSGKTTTSYSLIDEIMDRRPWACTTIEDPVERILPSQYKNGAMITQREIPSIEFYSALRTALRSNQDVIFVGEIRDPNGALLALEAAKTGHLVITTLHSKNIVSAIERFSEIASNNHISPQLVKEMLSDVFRACIWQELISRNGITGRSLSAKALFSSPGVSAKIRSSNLQSLESEIEIQKSRFEKERKL